MTSTACQQPTTLDIECLCSFSGVAGFLWPPPPINNPTSPEIERSRSFLEVVGFPWASATATTINNPPEPSKSSVHARFRVLLPLQPRKRVFALVVCPLYPPPPPRQPSDPITPEIERECSFLVFVVSLWLPTSTTPPTLSTNMVCFRVRWFPFPCCRFSFLSLLYSLSSFIP